jgi:peptidoglycan hydrolase FlgJ
MIDIAPSSPFIGNHSTHLALETSAKEFESIFLSTMLKPMFGEESEDNEFTGGHAEETWKPMLVDEYAKKLSMHGGIGLQPHILKTLIDIQEKANAA